MQLSDRALNRALMARQLLLERSKQPLVAALGQLLAMQAQNPKPPYLGLWSRLVGFEREALTRALDEREVVRATFVRATLHLLAAADYQQFRGAIQPVLDGGAAAVMKGRTLPEAGELLAAACEAFQSPSSFEAVRTRLVERFIGCDERGMGYQARMGLPLVQVPDGTRWGFPAKADFVSSEAWLGAAPAQAIDLPALVRRYLGAYGPASPKDMQTWSGLKGLAPVFKQLREELVVFKDARGTELYDLPDAPRPDENVPVPARLLPEFDGLILGLADRQRFIADALRPQIYVAANLRVLPTFLLDGMVAGTWSLAATKQKAVVTLTSLVGELRPEQREALADEALALARWAEPEARVHDVV